MQNSYNEWQHPSLFTNDVFFGEKKNGREFFFSCFPLKWIIYLFFLMKSQTNGHSCLILSKNRERKDFSEYKKWPIMEIRIFEIKNDMKWNEILSQFQMMHIYVQIEMVFFSLCVCDEYSKKKKIHDDTCSIAFLCMRSQSLYSLLQVWPIFSFSTIFCRRRRRRRCCCNSRI